MNVTPHLDFLIAAHRGNLKLGIVCLAESGYYLEAHNAAGKTQALGTSGGEVMYFTTRQEAADEGADMGLLAVYHAIGPNGLSFEGWVSERGAIPYLDWCMQNGGIDDYRTENSYVRYLQGLEPQVPVARS